MSRQADRNVVAAGARAHPELRHAQDLLDVAGIGVVTTDAAGRIILVNRSAATVLGGAKRFSGRDVREVLDLHVGPAQLLVDAPRLVFEHVLPGASGDVGEVELTLVRHDGASPQADTYSFVVRDLRPDREREHERRRLERLAAMGTMVAGFAHEVRNPVAALRSLTESLVEELADHGIRMPQVGHMMDVLGRIERLVSTSLQFGRPSPPRFAAHRPWMLASQALAVVGPRLREMGASIRVEVEPDLPDIVVDSAQAVQVLVNLLDNALDATGDPREVLLRAAMAPEGGEVPEVQLDVVDRGPGIPLEIVGRIFDPFFTTKPKGTGLGLSIAQQLVSENGGRLTVSAPRGGPTTFSLVFGVRRSLEFLTPLPTERARHEG